MQAFELHKHVGEEAQTLALICIAEKLEEIAEHLGKDRNRRNVNCPYCGEQYDSDFNFCPQCGCAN